MISKPATTTKATTQERGGFFNVLMRRPNFMPNATLQTPERKIICKDDISKTDKEAVIKLYEALVPGDKTRTVNVTMIVEEGFPVFEATIGSSNFQKLKKYFGIGCKPSKKGTMREQEITSLLEQLRTVENAQYYIDGYKQLLEMAAAKLCDAPEDMPMLERAKFVRMFHVIFVGYFFFAQDFKRTFNFQYKFYYLDVDFPKAIKNNSLPFNPEEFFTTSKILIESFSDNSLIYDLVCLELQSLDKKTQKEVLQFAELKINDEGKFVSVNSAPKYQTFSSIRAIKHRVHQEMGAYPMEMFTYRERIESFFFDDLYQLYKILRVIPLEKFKTHTKKESFMEGSREVLKDRIYYEVSEDFNVSGQAEINRILRMIEYLAAIGFKLKTSEGKECDMGIYMTAFNFLHSMKYVDVTIDPKKEFDYAELLMERDTTGALLEYKERLIDNEQLKARLGIDAAFEREQFGIVRIGTPEEIAVSFAVDNGYVEEDNSVSQQLLENVILPGNEVHFTEFASGEIDEATLKQRIGLEEEFAEMYFDLAKVDMNAIENKLQDLKRGLAKRGEMKRWALLISLYCYLIEEQVPCGPKNKVPKRNKGLKPANLKAQIA